MRGPVDHRRLDRPARRAGDEGEDFDPAAAAPPTSASVPFQLKPPSSFGLHGAPFDRDADAVDAAPLQPLELFGVRRRLRGDAPEIARHRRRRSARATPQATTPAHAIAAAHARSRPGRPLPVCGTGLAGLRRERGAGAVPLAPLANHDHARSRSRRAPRSRSGSAPAARNRRRRRKPGVAWSAGRRAARLPSPAGWRPCLGYPDPCRRRCPLPAPAATFRRWSFFRTNLRPIRRAASAGASRAAVLGRLGRLRDLFVLRTGRCRRR